MKTEAEIEFPKAGYSAAQRSSLHRLNAAKFGQFCKDAAYNAAVSKVIRASDRAGDSRSHTEPMSVAA